ncbi:hypothetical protein D3C80_1535760 [compost metagenome]
MKLVHNKRLIAIMLQQPDLGGAHVGDAEVADLTRFFELMQSPGNLLRVHQRVGPVQQQDIKIVCTEAG